RSPLTLPPTTMTKSTEASRFALSVVVLHAIRAPRRAMKRILVWASLGLAGLIVVLLLTLGVSGALYHADDRLPAGAAGKRVQVGDLSLRVLQRGAGRDLLFIHGSSGILEDFAPQLAALAPSFRVTAYDRPGHGYSSDGESHALAYNAKVALALIEKLGLQ